MIETTIEVCKHCGNKYEDTHIIPRALYAPFYCEQCMEELNKACGGSWVSAIYQASKSKTDLGRD